MIRRGILVSIGRTGDPIGRTGQRLRGGGREMRPMGGCQRRKPKIIAMHMTKRNDHLHRQREQR